MRQAQARPAAPVTDTASSLASGSGLSWKHLTVITATHNVTGGQRAHGELSPLVHAPEAPALQSVPGTHRRPFCTTRFRQLLQQEQAWLHSNNKGGSAMLNSGSSRPSWGQMAVRPEQRPPHLPARLTATLYQQRH